MAKVEDNEFIGNGVLLFAYNIAREEEDDSSQASNIDHNGLEGPEELQLDSYGFDHGSQRRGDNN